MLVTLFGNGDAGETVAIPKSIASDAGDAFTDVHLLQHIAIDPSIVASCSQNAITSGNLCQVQVHNPDSTANVM